MISICRTLIGLYLTLQINDNLTNTFVQNILCNSFDQIVIMPTRENDILDLVLCRNLDPLPMSILFHL